MKKLFKLLLAIVVAGASVKALASDVSPSIPKMNGMVVSSSSGSVTTGLWTLPSAQGEAWSLNFEMSPGYAAFYAGDVYKRQCQTRSSYRRRPPPHRLKTRPMLPAAWLHTAM